MTEKFYEPTGSDALGAYKVATVAHNLWPEDEYYQPCYAWQTTPGAFYVLIGEFYDLFDDAGNMTHDDNGDLLVEVTSCLYDRKNRLWLVRLVDETVAKVCDTGDDFVVVVDEE